MKAFETVLTRVVVGLAAGLLLNCGGSYGGGGGGGGGNPASLQIAVDPDTITLGESATITWSSNGRRCQASGAWTGEKTADGSETITPDEIGNLTYTLVCSGGGYGESEAGSVTLTVEPAALAGAWVGEACCAGSESFDVAGLTSEAGDQRILAAGTHWVGEAGKDPVPYATCEDCLAGSRLAKAPAYRLLSIAAQPPEQGDGVDAPQGSYTTFLSNGYTLTLAIDAKGGLVGADTNGCSLHGQVAGSRMANVFELQLTVASCGASDGRYAGEAALLPATGDRPAGLLLSTSNADAAIGWRLDR